MRTDHVELAHVVDGRGQRSFARQVRDEDQAGARALALLLHRLDRDLVVAEHARDRGEHTGLVGDVERHVELRRGLVDRADRLAYEIADRGAARPARTFLAASIRSPSTALAVGPPPAPRPSSISCPTASPSMNTALYEPRTDASGCVDRNHRRMHARYRRRRRAPRRRRAASRRSRAPWPRRCRRR